jgi:hypothetical protein
MSAMPERRRPVTLTPSLTGRCGPHTFDGMKDAVLTVRLPRTTRRRLEALARREGRSLSQQVERLIAQGLAGAPAPRRPRPLSGVLRTARVPSLRDFRQVRAQLATSLAGRLASGDERRR